MEYQKGHDYIIMCIQKILIKIDFVGLEVLSESYNLSDEFEEQRGKYNG